MTILKIAILMCASLALAPFATAFASTASSESLKDIKKVYYLLASEKGMGRSSFGHAYLRFGKDEKPRLDDLVLELVADTPANQVSTLRGLGIGKKYERTVILSSYQVVQYEMNYQQQRDLTSFEIKISDSQRQSFLNSVSEALALGKMGKYSFFGNNCAAGVSDLFAGVGIDVTGLSAIHPTWLAEQLQSKGMVASEYIDLSLNSRRVQLADNYSDVLTAALRLDPLLLKQHLVSEDAYARVVGFLRLNAVKDRLSVQDQKTLHRYLNSLAYLESRVLRMDLMKVLSGKGRMKVIPLPSKSIEKNLLNLENRQAAVVFQLSSSQLGVDNSKVVLRLRGQLKVEGRDRLNNRNPFYSVEIPDLTVRPDGAVLYNGNVAAVRSSKNFETAGQELIIPNGFIYSEVQDLPKRAGWKVSSFLVLDKEDGAFPLSFVQNMHIPLLNNAPQMPSCYGYVDLQKALLERAVFAPALGKLSAEQYLHLLSSILNPNVLVVFPGVRSVEDVFAQVDEAKVRNLVYGHHQANYATMSGAIKTYFDAEKLATDQGLKELKALTSLGVGFRIHFRYYQNGQSTPYGHALLIKDLHEKDGKVYLEAYDPNLSQFVSDFFYFDKKDRKLHSILYGVTDIQVMPENAYQTLALRKIMHSDFMKSLLDVAKVKGSYVFTLQDIMKAH